MAPSTLGSENSLPPSDAANTGAETEGNTTATFVTSYGGRIESHVFSGNRNGVPLAAVNAVREETEEYVEVITTAETGLLSVGPIAPVPVFAGKVYVVTAEIERLSDDQEARPTIQAFSLDSTGAPLENNWVVQFYPAGTAPQGEKTTLSARFAIMPPANSGINAFALPENVKMARFTVTPDRGTPSGQVTRIYSVKVEVK